MKTMNRLFENLKNLKKMFKKKISLYIKLLRWDNGGEYFLINFSMFLDEPSIKRTLTCHHSPQQNRLVERKSSSEFAWKLIN